MKKIASLTGILLVLMAGASFAAGLNLAWDNCLGSGGVLDKTVPCTSTTTNQTMVGSFVLSAPLNVTSTTNVVDVVLGTATPGAFWTLNTSGLGTNRFTFDANATGCPTWTNGEALDNVNGRTQSGNRMQLRINLVIGNFGADVPAGQEETSFRLGVIMTDAPANAADCQVPACFLYSKNFIEDALVSGGSETLTTPQVRNFATWGGAVGINCPAATPTKKATWGSIKALYR